MTIEEATDKLKKTLEPYYYRRGDEEEAIQLGIEALELLMELRSQYTGQECFSSKCISRLPSEGEK